MTAAPTLPTAAQLFQALSDPTRLEIVARLRNGERCVCDLQDLLDAAQSRLSFHLKVLRECGLVTDRREGRWIYYTLNADALAAARAHLDNLMPTAPRSEAGGCCT